MLITKLRKFHYKLIKFDNLNNKFNLSRSSPLAYRTQTSEILHSAETYQLESNERINTINNASAKACTYCKLYRVIDKWYKNQNVSKRSVQLPNIFSNKKVTWLTLKVYCENSCKIKKIYAYLNSNENRNAEINEVLTKNS